MFSQNPYFCKRYNFCINCCISGSQESHTCELETGFGFPYIAIIDSDYGAYFHYAPYRLCMNVFGAVQVYITSYSHSCVDDIDYIEVNHYTFNI